MTEKLCEVYENEERVFPDGGQCSECSLPSGNVLRMMFIGCKCAPELLVEGDILGAKAAECVEQAGLHVVNRCHFDFDGGGSTVALILAESHLVLHAWPEFDNMILADVNVCNYYRDNLDRVKRLKANLEELLDPDHSVTEHADMIPRLAEPRYPGSGTYVDIKEILTAYRSEYQYVKVVDTEAFGRALVLDDIVQTTEEDEFWYHEALVHTPMLAHPKPRRVLICGGGDGGSAEEVLKHPDVELCRVVELDEAVVDVSRKYLGAINRGAFDDPRVEVVCEDAFTFLERDTGVYDVIILDLTDPIGECEKLFSSDFFEMVRARMDDNSRLAAHVSFPTLWPETSRKIMAELGGVFGGIHPYMQFVPAYSDVMAFALCGINDFDPEPETELEKRIDDRKLGDLRSISAEAIRGMFSLNPFVRKTLYGT